MSETSLYPAVKAFLEEVGFCVKGEVNGCDAVAVHEGEPLRPAIVEMKLGFNLDLLLQAVDRMRLGGRGVVGRAGNAPGTRPGSPRASSVSRS